MEQELLPIGTVVTTKNSDVELMIIGYRTVINYDNKKEKYDYSSVRVNEGLKGRESMVLFNKDKIDKIVSYGYVDESFVTLKSKLEKGSE